MTAGRPLHRMPDDALIARFANIVGTSHALRGDNDKARYLTEWRDRYRGETSVVLRPGSTAEVSSILALAHAENVAIVTQAGNTGLVGGQIPSQAGNEIVLSVERLRAVRDIDQAAGTLTVEAGVTLADVQTIAREAGWMFPLSLASEGSARIGGVLATNAGGTAVIAHGNARRLALGLEAVFADGRVWDGLRQLKKDNTGYDLRDLLIGSEGTLAVITAATLALVPAPAEKAITIAGLNTLEDVLALYRLALTRSGSTLTSFEFWCADIEDFALKASPNLRRPLASRQPWSVLIELSGGTNDGAVTASLTGLLDEAMRQDLVVDASVAASGSHATDWWRLRDSFSEAQKIVGGSIKHDVSLPIAKLPDFIQQAAGVVDTIAPGARPVPFGHFGDGNVHYNVSQPAEMDTKTFLELWTPMSRAIHDLVVMMGGSFSAEHGIGRMKRDELARLRSPVEIDIMRAIKHALDPRGILNPGKII